MPGKPCDFHVGPLLPWVNIKVESGEMPGQARLPCSLVRVRARIGLGSQMMTQHQRSARTGYELFQARHQYPVAEKRSETRSTSGRGNMGTPLLGSVHHWKTEELELGRVGSNQAGKEPAPVGI